MKRILIFNCQNINCLAIRSELEKSYYVKLTKDFNEVPSTLCHFAPDIILCGNEFNGSPLSGLMSRIVQFTKAPVIAILQETDLETVPLTPPLSDFICSPVKMNELITRIELRTLKVRDSEAAPAIFNNGELLIDLENCHVYIGEKPVHLTMLEYRLICLLAKNRGKVVPYVDILNELWHDCIGGEIRSLRVIVAAVRDKLTTETGYPYIQTHMGIGYCMPLYNTENSD